VVGLVCVVLGSPNAGIGLVRVVLAVPIRIELAIVVVQSPNADVEPAYFWVLPKPVVSSLSYPFAVCWHASFWGSQMALGFWYSLGFINIRLLTSFWGSSVAVGYHAPFGGDSISALGSSRRLGSPRSRWAGWCCHCVS